MNAQFSVEKPGEIEMTLQITMKLKDWIELRKQLRDDHPSWQIGERITSMVTLAQRTFYPQDETQSPEA